MDTLVSKLLCAAAFTFAAGANVYGQSSNSCCPAPKPDCCPPRFEQGMPLCCDTYPRAFNAPARIDVTGCSDWDVYGSFIYWHVSQESMDVGVKSFFDPTIPTDGATFPTTIAFQTFKYKPGFKVGAGFSFGDDGWVCFAEYTRLHQKTVFSRTVTAPTFWAPTDWFALGFVEGSTGDTAYRPTTLTAKWKMNFDRVDLSFSRPFYQGKRITVSPYGGMRGLWITQVETLALNPNTASVATAVLRSHCWSVGPNGGVETNWLVGWGFRFEGMAGASLLYTRYTTTAVKQTVTAISSSDGVPESLNAINNNVNVLRPMMEMGVGIGWGTYLSCQEWYMDLSVRYDFLQLWDQNVMRHYTIGVNSGVAVPADNMQMHGITATARFDF